MKPEDEESESRVVLRQLSERLSGLQLGLGTIAAVRRYCLRSVSLDSTGLLVVLSGRKVLRLGSRTFSCRAGEYAIVHHAECVDMEAIPDASTGLFRAWVLSFDNRIVAIARLVLSQHPQRSPSGEEPISVGLFSILEAPLKGLVDLLASSKGHPDPAQIDLALAAILVALGRSGHDYFLRPRELTLSSRIRTLVASNPSREWVSAHFERELHVSGATLRRKLNDEGTSLRELLREGRLLHGLSLLQTTQNPMKTVALRSGYRSVSSFRKNFAARFGVEAATVAQSPWTVQASSRQA